MTKRALRLMLVLMGVALSLWAQAPRSAQPSAQPFENPPTVQHDVAYGTVNGHPLLLDIYQPGEVSVNLRPAIILIHGGGWISFDKSIMSGMGNFLARSGLVAFAVDYRLMQGKKNLWPAQLHDVQRAVRWIRANASKYRVDPDHIGAFGHSAGAQLAALLGMEDTRDNSDPALAKYSSKVQAVVDVSGPSDFTTNHDADGDAFLTVFFGGDYAHNAAAWRDASPVFHVAKGAAPFLVLHGTHDDNVPLAQAQELADKLKEAKVPVKLITVEDVHTFEKPENRRLVAYQSGSFFNEYLRAAALR
ncbi:MAG: alpha/beta hydrolase fold domain-containing protein [Candidatus Sulfotelmatobacter sp.]